MLKFNLPQKLITRFYVTINNNRFNLIENSTEVIHHKGPLKSLKGRNYVIQNIIDYVGRIL